MGSSRQARGQIADEMSHHASRKYCDCYPQEFRVRSSADRRIYPHAMSPNPVAFVPSRGMIGRTKDRHIQLSLHHIGRHRTSDLSKKSRLKKLAWTHVESSSVARRLCGVMRHPIQNRTREVLRAINPFCGYQWVEITLSA